MFKFLKERSKNKKLDKIILLINQITYSIKGVNNTLSFNDLNKYIDKLKNEIIKNKYLMIKYNNFIEDNLNSDDYIIENIDNYNVFFGTLLNEKKGDEYISFQILLKPNFNNKIILDKKYKDLNLSNLRKIEEDYTITIEAIEEQFYN